METPAEILIDDQNPLFNRQGMLYKEFPSDLRQIKYFARVIMQYVPAEIKGRNLMEKQILELIKNGMKHGNKKDRSKKITVHFAFTPRKAHLIIKDEGMGFREIEQWNEFYRQRCLCNVNQDYDAMEKYKSFKTKSSDAEDQGSFLFHAIQFWNGGIIFNSRRNCVAVLKIYPEKNYGIQLSDEE